MSDLDLAALMGVGTHEVLTALRIPIQQGAVTFLRMPGERRMLGLTETGVAHLTMIDLEPRVLDLLDSFGPRSPLDISQDLAVGREITQVLAKLTQGGWITGGMPRTRSTTFRLPTGVAPGSTRRSTAAPTSPPGVRRRVSCLSAARHPDQRRSPKGS